MTERARHEAIQYRNQEFAIHHLIADCPPATVIRELVKNADENAVLLQPPGRIEWFIEEVEGVPKLGLYNEGPGMDGEELLRLMDLASTGKTLGLDNNYGQGGKISALKVSPHGVVYRSCKAGRVSQIMLAAEQKPGSDIPTYVKQRQAIQEQRSDRPLDREWTEVVLLGRNALHETVADLLPEMRVKNWLMRLLNRRFFRFSDGVVVRGGNITTDAHENRNASGLEKLTANHSERKPEDVRAEHPRFGPVVIRYCKLRGQYGEDEAGNSRAKTMEAYGLGPRGDHVCLVWKGECYDVHVGWSQISGAFGVTFGSSNIAIQILLPDNALKNNTYRDAVLDRRGEHQPVRVEDFAELVRCNRPKWLVQYIEREARKNSKQSGVEKRLKAFLDEFKAPGQNRCKVEPGGEDDGEAPARTRRGSGSSADKPYAIDDAPRSTRPAKGHGLPSRLPGIPKVAFAEDPAILEEMAGRAAMYRQEENTVLLNPRHFKYQSDLEKMFEDVGPGADRRSLAKQLFDEEYSFNAGKFVIQAWLFKDKPHWEEQTWQQGVNMVPLTIHLAAPESLEAARRKLRQKLNSRKLELQNL